MQAGRERCRASSSLSVGSVFLWAVAAMAVRAMMLVRVLRRRGVGRPPRGPQGPRPNSSSGAEPNSGKASAETRESAASAGTATVMAPELLKHLDALLEAVIGFLLQALDDAAQVVGQLRDLVIGQAFEE